MLFYPAMSAAVTWFFEKRAMALGIAASGSGLGGVIFPIIVSRLIPQVGFGWTMRICAFLVLGLMIVTNLSIISRIPPHPRPVSWRDFIMPFAELPFFLLTFGSFLMFMGNFAPLTTCKPLLSHTGLFLPFNFLILVATQRHVSESLTIYLVSILNAGSIFGRILPTFLADKIGRFTVFVAVSALSCILIVALWLPGSGTGATIAFCVLFGFTSGAVVALPPTLVASISDVKQIGVRTGAMFSWVAVAVLVGSPIGGQLYTANNGSYKTMQIFSSVLTAAGTLCFAALRVRLGGLSLRKKV
jgi:MFS family permease